MTDRSAALAGLCALAIAMGIGRFAFTPILPMMQSEGLVSVVEGGWLASANYAGYLAGALTAASIRFAPRLAIRAALVLVGISTLGMGLAPDIGSWLALRFIAGVTSAWVFVFSSAWCLERIQHARAHERALLSATLFSGVGVGIAAAGTLCVGVLVAHATASMAWLLLGVVSLAGAGALWNAFAGTDARIARERRPARLWSAESVRLVVCYGAFGFGYIIPATFLAAMAREAIGDPAVYGWSWPVFGAAAAVSTFAATRLRRGLSDRGTWILGHLVMAAGVMVPIALAGVPGIVLSAILVGGTFMVVTMAGMQEARSVAGENARALMAAMTSAFALGQIAGPLAVSALAARGGFVPCLIAAGLALVASAVALVPRTVPRSSP